MLRLYDRPLHRDWAFWMTVGWGCLEAVAVPTSKEPHQIPVWLDTVLAVMCIVAILGVFPAWTRLLLRRWLWRRSQRGLLPTPASSGPHPDLRTSDIPPLQEPMRANGSPAPDGQTAPQFRSGGSARPSVSSHPSGSDARRTYLISADDVSHQEDESPCSSDVLTDARRTLPHPVARAVHALELAHTPKDQYEAILDTAETLAITISVTAAALLQGVLEESADDREEHHGAKRCLSALRTDYTGRGAMFGAWTNWLETLSTLMADSPEPIPGFLPALQGRFDDSGIVKNLNTLRRERNRSAHGDKPKSQAESALRVEECSYYLRHALTEARFLRNTPWLLTVSSDYQPRRRNFHVIACDATGDHPDFARRTFVWEHPVGGDIFYTLTQQGPVTLSPFVANSFCSQCRQTEVCYAYRTGKKDGPAIFKSFGRGHEIPILELGDDIRSLPTWQGNIGAAE